MYLGSCCCLNRCLWWVFCIWFWCWYGLKCCWCWHCCCCRRWSCSRCQCCWRRYGRCCCWRRYWRRRWWRRFCCRSRCRCFTKNREEWSIVNDLEKWNFDSLSFPFADFQSDRLGKFISFYRLRRFLLALTVFLCGTNAIFGGSPGTLVMWGDSCSEGHGFESQHCILDGHFHTYLL